MTTLKGLIAGALCAATIFATPVARAADISFGLRGIFTGSIDQIAFAGRSLTFSATGDGEQVEEIFGETLIGLTSVTISDGDITWTLTDPSRFFFNPLDGIGGIVDQYGSLGLVRFTYDRSTSPMSVNYYGDALSGDFSTDSGFLRIDGASNMSLETSFAAIPAAVPEPGSWLMMILGFAVVGATLRSRPAPLAARSIGVRSL